MTSTAAGADAPIETVQFWFDPLCPWAWIASRWMLEVEKVRPVRLEWKIMSLAYLNLVQHGGEGLSDDYRALMEEAWGPVRVCAAAAAAAGSGVLGPLYGAIGTRFHNEGRRGEPGVLAEALVACGLPADLEKAAEDDTNDAAIIASHLEAFDEVGLDVGTPVLRVRETAFFGPVISPAPRGEEAGRLFDGVVAVAGTDGFFEIKRSRTRPPLFD